LAAADTGTELCRYLLEMAMTEIDMTQRLAVLEAKMRDFNSELHVDGLLVSQQECIN